MTGLDIKTNEPEKFEGWIVKEIARLPERRPVEEALQEIRFTDFDLSKDLSREVQSRVIPFFYDQRETINQLTSGAKPHFPITGVPDLLLADEQKEPQFFDLFRRSTDKISDLWLAASFGALSVEYEKELGDLNILGKPTEVSEQNLVDVIREVAEWDQVSRIVPFSFCRRELSPYRSFRFTSHQEPALIIVGDTLEDFCLYHCLSRLRGGVVWFPSSLDEDTGYPRHLAHTAMHLRHKVDNDRVALYSYTLRDEQLQEYAKRLTSVGLHSFVSVGYQPGHAFKYRRFVLARQSSPKPIAGQFLGNALVGFVETPKPLGFSHPTKHRWITDVEIQGYIPPRHPYLAPSMVGVRGDTQDVRTTRYGWSYRSPHEGTYFGGELDEVLVRPTLKIMEMPEILQVLGRRCDLRFSPSEKGTCAREFIAKFESLENAARFLREKKNRDLFDAFLSTERVDPNVFNEGVYTQGRRYFDLISLEKIIGTRDAAATLLDDLLEKHVLHRGLVFQCKSCRNSDWYSVAKVSESFECSRCGKSQPYRKENWKHPEEPSWYYKLDELIYQGYKNGMIAPILTNDLLRVRSSSFQFAAEQEVFEKDAADPFMEIDVCVVSDGEILVGESKRSAELENGARERKRTIEKYRGLAQRLGNHGVVFSTLAEEWSPGTLKDIHESFSASRMQVIIFTRNDLLPATAP